ncbi:MAG TPA: hypothetical protein VGH10_10660 [Actinomycetota bacterium]|jgi:folate-binding protein YgfZ
MGDDDVLRAIDAGLAFVDRSWWRKIAVTGSDAAGWLGDLISADISGLRSGGAAHSLLLSPTGSVRATFTVAMPGDALLLIQDPSQAPVERLLAPYVLSSDVRLVDRSAELALFAFPAGSGIGSPPGALATSPSSAGAGAGTDLTAAASERDPLAGALSSSRRRIGEDDVERWRVRTGVPKLGVDAFDSDLPQEAGLATAVSFNKGCYLGQEAVARTNNLGHPRRVVLHLTADDPVAAGDAVLTGDDPAGDVTSSTQVEGRWWLLARVRWESHGAALRTAGGVPLVPAGAAPKRSDRPISR